MERLTNENHKEMGFCAYVGSQNPFKTPLTIGELAGCLNEDYSPRKILEDILNRLAAYEDTGLEPDEITTEPYGCVFYCNRTCNLDGDFCVEGPGCPREIDVESAKHLLELAQIEKEGRLGVLEPTAYNDPLTLEQLLEMDGELVWVIQPGYKSRYGLVRTTSIGTMLVFNDGKFVAAEFTMLERGCKVFRRKPEELK